MASATTSSTVEAPGIGVVLSGEDRTPSLGQQGAQRRGVGGTEDQAQHVDALVVELGPESFGHDRVEGLRGGVGDHVGPADHARPRGQQNDPAPAPLDHRAGEVVADLQGHGQLRWTIASAASTELARNGW